MRCQQPWVDSARWQSAQLICDRAQLSLQRNDRSNMQTHLVLNAASPSFASSGLSVERLSLARISTVNWEVLVFGRLFFLWLWVLLFSQHRHKKYCEKMKDQIAVVWCKTLNSHRLICFSLAAFTPSATISFALAASALLQRAHTKNAKACRRADLLPFKMSIREKNGISTVVSSRYARLAAGL